VSAAIVGSAVQCVLLHGFIIKALRFNLQETQSSAVA
jgi:hypothetical protein